MHMEEWLERIKAAVVSGDRAVIQAALLEMRAQIKDGGPDAPVHAHRAVEARPETERDFLRIVLGDAIGDAFLAQERLDAAEHYLEQTLDQAGKREPFDALTYARALEPLGQLYGRQHRLAYAVECANRCLAQRKSKLAPDDPSIALCHLQLGALHRECGLWQAAWDHFRVALEPLHQAGDEWRWPYQLAVMGAADSMVKAGMLDAAQQALENIPGIAVPLDAYKDRSAFPGIVALALVKRARGDTAAGRELAQRAQVAGRGAPFSEIWRPVFLDLADLQATFGAFAEAVEALRWVSDIDRGRAQRLLDTVHFSQRILYSDSLAAATGDLLRLVLDKLPGDEAAARVALEVVMSRKSLLTEADFAHNHRSARFGGAGRDAQIAEIESLRARLRQVRLDGPTDGNKKLWDATQKLTREIRDAECRLAASLESGLYAPASTVTVAEVAARLAVDEALIEYVALRVPPVGNPLTIIEPDLLSEVRVARYAAFVLTHDARVHLVDLGAAEPIETLVYSYLAAAHPSGYLELSKELQAKCIAGDEPGLGAQLRAAIFDPLAPHLPSQVRKLRIAPDGALAAVSFAALPGEGEQRLIDQFETSCLNCGRVLLRTAVDSPPPAAPLILAHPDYDAGPLPQPVDPAAPPAFWFAPLPNSVKEAAKVQQRIGGRVALGAEASCDALLGAASPAVLHVATHGFFLPAFSRGINVIGNWRASGMGLEMRGDVLSFTDEPLLRSGLALAGVNAYSSGLQTAPELGDGLVTALDVARVDLARTQLVFLSACSTARGTVRPGEGSAGLLQSFQAAGARSIVAALWATADHPATVTFVDRFYARLRDGDTVPAALRQSQRELRQLGAPLWVWASFTAHGDPRVTWGSN